MARLTRRGLLAGSAAVAACGTGAGDRPNVLVILVDQLRAHALSLHGETNVATPVFDDLLASGAWFERAWCANPHCTPARSALLSGLYPSVTSTVTTGLPLPLVYPAWSDALAAVGYRGGYIGKWHVHGGVGPVPIGPSRRGFDAFWRAFETNGHRYTDSIWYEDDRQPHRPDPPDTYEPDYQTDHALEFLDSVGAGPDPFMLVVSYGPPHPPAELTSTIGEWTGWIPQVWLDGVDRSSIVPNPNVPSSEHDACRVFLHGYYAALRSLEPNVDRLLRGLEARGLREDTIVVFTSDHGELAGAHGFFGKERPFDEALRVPFGISWPGRIAPRRVVTPINGVDLAPTLRALCGAEPAPGHGTDLSPLLFGGSDDGRPEGVFAQGRQEEPAGAAWEAVRTDRWMYALTEDGRSEALFDLQADPWQRDDRSHDPSAAGDRDALRGMLADWRARLGS